MNLLSLWRDLTANGYSFELVGTPKQQRQYIRDYEFPLGLRVRFAREHPSLSLSQREQVFRALRQYFLVCHASGHHMSAMPSQIVDEAWHQFILFTRDYNDFCRRAFGRYLHHTPAEAMSTPTQAQDGIKRAWRLACRQEKIDPLHPRHLPLLFAIDAALQIPNGFFYQLDCMTAQMGAGPSSNHSHYCATHIGCGAAGCGGASCGGNGGDSGCGDGSGSGDGGSGCGGGSCGGGGCGGG